MANVRKYYFSKEDLIRNKVKVTFDSNGNPVIHQEYIMNDNNNRKGRWKEIRTQNVITANHSFGNEKKYVTTNIKIDGKKFILPVSNIVWIYFNDRIPEGYEVDHINDDGLDNRLENLQLLTISDNIKKRKFSGANQYVNSTTHDYESFMKLKEKRNIQLQECENNILDIKQRIAEKELELKQLKQDWHDEVAKRELIKKGIA